MRIAIVGTGGVGGYFGGRLAAAGADIAFLARGAHLDALRTRGLRIVSPKGDVDLPRVHAFGDTREIGPVEAESTRGAAERGLMPLLVLFTNELFDLETRAGDVSKNRRLAGRRGRLC